MREACTCELCGPESRTYTCPWCRRDVPWCFGADGDMPLVCDDCYAEALALGPDVWTQLEGPREGGT